MKKWFNDRFDEPSSWVAFGGLFTLLSVIFKSPELQVVADNIAANGQDLAVGNYASAAVNIAAGVAFGMGFGKKEKGLK